MTVIYVALLLPVLLGITAFSVDLSLLYSRKAKSQGAADAAALGGAWQLANFNNANADDWARWYAKQPENGSYTDGVNGTTVTIEYPAVDHGVTPNVTRSNWYRVTIERPEPTFFAGIFGAKFRKINVKSTAVALYETLAELNINGGGTYGKAPGPVNLSLFGPDGFYNNGDSYSVKRLANGSPNPLYTGKGYDFTINVNSFAGSTAHVQIFDPDCYNSGVTGTTSLDEYRDTNGNPSDASNATTTQYSLYDDNGTPFNTTDDKLLVQRSYGADSSTDLIWNDFAAVKKSDLTGNMRMNVLSTSGSSENGFDLRVSDKPPLSRANQTSGLDNFNASNGSVITAQGHLPMNFNQNGTTSITLGVIPVQAAGGQLTVRKFDTDVGAKSITYQCSTLPGKSWPGVLASNGTFQTDTIQVPTSYTTAGVWTATYASGVGDTSVWDMSYSNYGPGKPGGIKLIR